MDKDLKKKKNHIHNLQSMIDAPVTLKQGQSCQIWYKLMDPKHGYDNAKFEKPRLNSVREKANNRVL